MGLHIDHAFSRASAIILSGRVEHETTKIALHIMFLHSQKARNDLELDLSSPLAAVMMSLPMVHNQLSRVKVITAMDAPLLQKTCKTRRMPQPVKLSGKQNVSDRLIHGQM